MTKFLFRVSLMTKFAYRVFLILGCILLIISLVFVVNRVLFLQNAISVKGKVIELQELKDKDSDGITYKPVVVFSLEDGQDITFISSVGSYPPAFKVGETVDVLYIPENPLNAVIDSFISLWFIQLLFAIMGCIFILISISAKRRFLGLNKPKGTLYSIEFSGKELLYLLFKKKKCLLCGDKLDKLKEKENIGVGYEYSVFLHYGTKLYKNRYVINYKYRCLHCNQVYTIKELADKSIKNSV